MSDTHLLGAYLKNRRTRLDPAAFGIAGGRRRTAGLRREEVALRANISVTWYTWLEQGRGGPPSAEVLGRVAEALTLTEAEREHVFLLGLGRPPDVHYRAVDPVSPRLQRVLDVLTYSPAIVRTATWDVVAWNTAASVILSDYAAMAPDERNVLRRMFSDARVRAAQPEWESVARFVVATFRSEATRAGADAATTALVDELSRSSPEFAAMWQENDVRRHGDGVKQLRHPLLGMITLDYSTFAVDGRPDLHLIVYNAATVQDQAAVRALIDSTSSPAPC